jgi:SAM-dependent methyltransferase
MLGAGHPSGLVETAGMAERSGHHHEPGVPPAERRGDDVDWDGMYADSEQVWSGEPNGALVAEVATLPPGRALDVGCGEGADAVWLARRGWAVTALDVARSALDRGRRAARQAGVEVRWLHAGLLDAPLSGETFDLVSALYPALRTTPDGAAVRALLALVAPGGTLLVVHHDVDPEHAGEHGFDPADYVSPADVAAALDGSWVVEADERRPRRVSGGAGAGHTHDLVVRARRRG